MRAWEAYVRYAAEAIAGAHRTTALELCATLCSRYGSHYTWLRALFTTLHTLAGAVDFRKAEE